MERYNLRIKMKKVKIVTIRENQKLEMQPTLSKELNLNLQYIVNKNGRKEMD